MIPKIVFCPICRRPIKIPLNGSENIQVLTNITIECGHETKFKGKSVKCTGKVIIKSKKQDNGNNVLTTEGNEMVNKTTNSESV